MANFAQKVAVITGAGSGIGQALATELARRGAKLAISDIDAEGLARTEELLRGLGAPVKADRLDVTEREAVVAYADAVNAHFGAVNQIYNIAGIAFLGDVEVTEFKDLERVTGSSRFRVRPRTTLRSSRCGASPKLCAKRWRWRGIR